MGKEERLVRLDLRVPKRQREQLDTEAAAEGITVSELARRIFSTHLKRYANVHLSKFHPVQQKVSVPK